MDCLFGAPGVCPPQFREARSLVYALSLALLQSVHFLSPHVMKISILLCAQLSEVNDIEGWYSYWNKSIIPALYTCAPVFIAALATLG